MKPIINRVFDLYKNNSGRMVILAIIYALFGLSTQKSQHRYSYHPIKLALAPPETTPTNWDPPPDVIIMGENKYKIHDETIEANDLKPFLHDFFLIQNHTQPGISLHIMPDATIQEIINFLDYADEIGTTTAKELKEKSNITLTRPLSYLFYHSDTLKSINHPKRCQIFTTCGLTSPSTPPASRARTQSPSGAWSGYVGR